MRHLKNLFLSVLVVAEAYAATPVRILQHNIRAIDVGALKPNEKSWAIRLPGQIAELRYHLRFAPLDTFITLQEVKYQQLKDLITNLNRQPAANFKQVQSSSPSNPPRRNAQNNGRLEYSAASGDDINKIDGTPGEWGYIGIGRDDGNTAGEFSPIFYRKSRWELLQWETTWFSDTPFTYTNARSWGGCCARIITIGLFRSKENPDRNITVMSTHLDDNYWYVNETPRRKSYTLITQIFDWWVGRTSGSSHAVPCMLGADFNGETRDPGYPLIKPTQNTNILTYLQSNPAWTDRIWGPLYTYTSFGGEYYAEPLDYVFLSPPVGTPGFWQSVEGYMVSEAGFGSANNTRDSRDVHHVYNDNPILNSDHRLVVGDFSLE